MHPSFFVSEMRLELTRTNVHYPLKVARLPIPPSGHLAPRVLRQEPLPWEGLSEKRDSNPRPRPWLGRALPTELFSQVLHHNFCCCTSVPVAFGDRRTADAWSFCRFALQRYGYFLNLQNFPLLFSAFFIDVARQWAAQRGLAPVPGSGGSGGRGSG